jgi:hypothetical protein
MTEDLALDGAEPVDERPHHYSGRGHAGDGHHQEIDLTAEDHLFQVTCLVKEFLGPFGVTGGAEPLHAAPFLVVFAVFMAAQHGAVQTATIVASFGSFFIPKAVKLFGLFSLEGGLLFAAKLERTEYCILVRIQVTIGKHFGFLSLRDGGLTCFISFQFCETPGVAPGVSCFIILSSENRKRKKIFPQPH